VVRPNSLLRLSARNGSGLFRLTFTRCDKGDEVTENDFPGPLRRYFPSTPTRSEEWGVPTEPETCTAPWMSSAPVVTLPRGLFGLQDPRLVHKITARRHFSMFPLCLRKTWPGVLGPDGATARGTPTDFEDRSSCRNTVSHRKAIRQLAVAVDEARVALRRSRKVPYHKPRFDFNPSESLIEILSQIVGMIALAWKVISSVGLMSGGVGV